MEYFLQKLVAAITTEFILSKITVDDNFKFEKIGWYFFISPISGIIKIKRVKPYSTATNDVSKVLGFKLLTIIGCDNQFDLQELNSLMSKNINLLNELQKKSIKILGENKRQISEPGVYPLKLITKTENHVNNSKLGSYYLFNAIDSNIISFYVDKIDSKTIDNYLNEPFYYFMYYLEGFMIHEQYLDPGTIKELRIGKIYKCDVDYINRNSLVDKQLAIKQIILPLTIKSF